MERDLNTIEFGPGVFSMSTPLKYQLFRDEQCTECGAHTTRIHPHSGPETKVPVAFQHRALDSYLELPQGILEKYHACVKSAFGNPNFPGPEINEHLKGHFFITAFDGDDIAAFSSSIYGSPQDIMHNASLPAQEGVYLSAGVVKKEMQGNRIYESMLMQRILNGIDKNLSSIYTQTQNPVVELSIIHCLEMLKEHGTLRNFSLQRVKLPKLHGRQLADKLPTVKDKEILQAYDPNVLNTAQGDVYVLLFQLERGRK